MIRGLSRLYGDIVPPAYSIWPSFTVLFNWFLWKPIAFVQRIFIETDYAIVFKFLKNNSKFVFFKNGFFTSSEHRLKIWLYSAILHILPNSDCYYSTNKSQSWQFLCKKVLYTALTHFCLERQNWRNSSEMCRVNGVQKRINAKIITITSTVENGCINKQYWQFWQFMLRYANYVKQDCRSRYKNWFSVWFFII